MSTGILVVLGVLVAGGFYLIFIYNNLVALKNRFKNAYSQIDVQLKRRYDLIPNLVETAKAYMTHERETLEAVINARNTAATANEALAKDPTNVHAIDKLDQAEGVLSGVLGRLFALSENYPELKANETMNKLMEELKVTENHIAFARESFNISVMDYNTHIESFPDNMIASTFKFKQARLWEMENEQEGAPVKVEF